MFLCIKFSLLKAQKETEWIAATWKKKKSPKALRAGKGQDYFHPATACFNLTTASLSTFGSYSFTTQTHKFGIHPAWRSGNDILGRQLHPPCPPTPQLDKTFEVHQSQTGARAHCLGSGGLGEPEHEVGRHGRHFGSLSGPRGFVSKSLTSRSLREHPAQGCLTLCPTTDATRDLLTSFPSSLFTASKVPDPHPLPEFSSSSPF